MAISRLKSGARPDSSAGSNWGLTADDMDVSYEGAVLGTWEHNGYNDSDFYALVWTGEELRGIEYATTRGWTYANGATEDATDEVKAAAAGWLAARDIASWNIAAAHDALMIEKGDEVEIYKGRKVPIGTTGTVIWDGVDKYQGKQRLGIKDADGEAHWTAGSNARKLNAAQSITTIEEIVTRTRSRLTRLRETGTGSDWVSAYRSYGGAIHGRFTVEQREIDSLLAEIGRTEITAEMTAAVLAASDAAEAERAAAEADWHAELDKPKAERDDERVAALAIEAGIIEADDTAARSTLLDIAAQIDKGT